MTNRKFSIFAILVLFIIFYGFYLRTYGLSDNHSFWNDEVYVAIFSRAIVERGKPELNNGFRTTDQPLLYWLSFLPIKIFGLSEFSMRLPSVFFGFLTIWAVYLLGKELFNKNIGLVAAALTTFLKIEILWSRQARPYQALQFFYLLSAWFIYKLTQGKKFNWHYFVGFLGCGVLSSLMHGLGLVVFFVGFLYLLIFRFSWFKNWAFLGGIFFIAIISYFLRPQIAATLAHFGNVNNFFYYRVFLWHNYFLLVFLALIGFLSQIFQKKKSWRILILFLVVQAIIVSFILPQPFVRYFYIVFPFLVLFSATGLVEIARFAGKKLQLLILAILILLVLGFGNKFTLFPQKVYSLNEDMQEIPEVDYKKIYAFVEGKLDENPEAVYVSNWNDHPIWYLGEGKLDYLLRLEQRYDQDPFSGAFYIRSRDELAEIIREKPKGLILLESWESELPEGAREYIRANLNKELEVDRLYPVQPRYWPVEIYSWGIEK